MILVMQLCQMVVQAMWITDSPLLQVVDKDLAQTLNSLGIQDINDFVNMEDEDRLKALKGYEKEIGKIADMCNRYPVVTMTASVKEAGQE